MTEQGTQKLERKQEEPGGKEHEKETKQNRRNEREKNKKTGQLREKITQKRDNKRTKVMRKKVTQKSERKHGGKGQDRERENGRNRGENDARRNQKGSKYENITWKTNKNNRSNQRYIYIKIRERK